MNFLGKMVDINTWHSRIGTFSQKSKKVFQILKGHLLIDLLKDLLIAGSLESANWSILAVRRLFKEVVGKKIRILC